MWNLTNQKFTITYAYYRVFPGNSGNDVDVSLEVVTNVKPVQLALGLVNISNAATPTLDRTEKSPIVAESTSGNSVVIAARFSNVPPGTYQAVVSDGNDGAPSGNIVVP